MKKHQIILMALFAVLAFSAVATTSATAEITLLAEWLLEGVPVLTLTSVTTVGLLALSTLVLGINGVEVHCEGIFLGTVGPNGEDETTELLNASEELISNTPLVGLSLSCTVIFVVGNECTAVGTLAELWPLHMPGHTLLELMENGTILDHSISGANGFLGYEVRCLNGKENECSGLTSATMSNSENTVTSLFDATSEKVSCTIGEGDITGEGLIKDLVAGSLTVSSE
jgi:hypothetical protein